MLSQTKPLTQYPRKKFLLALRNRRANRAEPINVVGYRSTILYQLANLPFTPVITL